MSLFSQRATSDISVKKLAWGGDGRFMNFISTSSSHITSHQRASMFQGEASSGGPAANFEVADPICIAGRRYV
jgi:hypothetical protein